VLCDIGVGDLAEGWLGGPCGGLGFLGGAFRQRIDLVVRDLGALDGVTGFRLFERHLGVGSERHLPLLAADSIAEKRSSLSSPAALERRTRRPSMTPLLVQKRLQPYLRQRFH
jgi:hypothetical protein